MVDGSTDRACAGAALLGDPGERLGAPGGGAIGRLGGQWMDQTLQGGDFEGGVGHGHGYAGAAAPVR